MFIKNIVYAFGYGNKVVWLDRTGKDFKKEKTMKKHLWLTIALVVVDCIATIVVYTGDANVFTKLCWWFNDARMWEIPLLLLWGVYRLINKFPKGEELLYFFKKQKEENLKMKQEIKTFLYWNA